MALRAALLLALPLLACGPKVSPRTGALDEDLGGKEVAQEGSAASAAAIDAPRTEAPAGKGLRTGTIARDKLVAVLDAGPGAFLRQLEIAPQLNGERFVGWQLVQLLDRSGPLVDVDVVPGDVLLAINGQPLSRPDQLQTVWDSLRTANQVTAQLWRGQKQFSLDFAIEPKLGAK
jgi:S1-C subfamily serine protease